MNGGETQHARCPRCATPGVFAAGDGLCPGCLLEAALVTEVMDEPMEEPASGGSCGGYQLERVLGRGGNGVVYLARKPGAEGGFALKMLASARLAGPDELRRFRLEAEASMSLDHPNIVTVLEVGEEDGIPYFVMEQAPGGSLADRLFREQDADTIRTTIRERVILLLTVARAVQFAHEHGVLHRDLKPANILIDARGNPLVSDFGLARMIHAPSGVTMTGAALGTPSYMSPEQAAGVTVTTASDVFSLGSVLFHLLTGVPPFQGGTALETLRLVSGTDAPDPRGKAPWVDRDLAMICLKALRREVNGRYPSAAALADDLERWSKGESVMARPRSLPERCMKWCGRHPILATLGVTGSIAASILAVVFITGSMILKEERNEAIYQKSVALRNAREATRARDESRLNSYAADVYLASKALEEGHLGLARRMLARHEPKAGLPDLRGFEWRAFSNRCRGDEARAWTDHTGAVMAVAFSPDGTLLASAGRDGRVFIRSVESGETVLALPKPDAPKDAAEIPLMTAITSRSAEMKQVLLGGGLNPDELRMRGRPSKLGEISTLAWSPDGKWIATGGLGGYVRMWSVPDGRLTGLIPVYSADALSFASSGGHLIVHAMVTEDPSRLEIRIYQTDELSLVRVIPDVQAAHAVSPDGRTLAFIGSGRTSVTLHDIAGGQVIRSIETSVNLSRIVFSPDGGLLWGVERSGVMAGCWNVSDGKRVGSMFPISGRLDLIAPMPDGKHMASTAGAQAVMLQHVSGASPALLMNGHEDVVRSLAVSPDGRFLASGGNDHSCRMWSTEGGTKSVRGDPRFPQLQFEPNPAGVYQRTEAGSWTGEGNPVSTLRLVSASGKELRRIKAPQGLISRMVTSDDGTLAGAYYWPRDLRVYDFSKGKWSDRWRLSAGTVGPVVFSPDSKWIASGGDDNAVTVRDSGTGTVLATLRGHQGSILDLAFAPDGRTLVSSSEDRSLRLWHTATWRELGILHQGEKLGRIVFSRDGGVLRGYLDPGNHRDFSGAPR